MSPLTRTAFKMKFSLKESFERLRRGEAAMSPEDRKKELFFVCTLLALGAAAVFTFSNFIQIQKIGVVEGGGQNAASDGRDVLSSARNLNDKYGAYLRMREQSSELAAMAESVGRSPIASVVPPPAKASETSVPEFVPTIRIKALVVLGGSSTCMLDIDNEEPGTIYRPGSTFGKGKGRILSIDTKGVTWRWASKKFHTPL